MDEDWLAYVEEQRRAELDRIIVDENLNSEEAYKFMDNAFRDGFVQTTGTAITKVLPPVSRFTPTGDRTKKRETVIEKLTAFFNRFWDIMSLKQNNNKDMGLFSERYGYTKPSDVIIRERITPEIQNAICSCYDKLHKFFMNSGSYMHVDDGISGDGKVFVDLFFE